jgi:uncharacterized membrane protein
LLNDIYKQYGENSMVKKFKVKDIVYLAIISAELTIVGMLTMPLVMSITLFGVRNITVAIVYPIFCVIALMKIRSQSIKSLKKLSG